MLIGYLNDIPFEASNGLMRTFYDFSRDGSARWATHAILGAKPKLEFIGAEVEKIGFKMLLRADMGVNPSAELEKLIKLRDKGKPFPLVIGNRPINNSMWVLTNISSVVKSWTRGGHIFSVEVNVELVEYGG